MSNSLYKGKTNRIRSILVDESDETLIHDLPDEVLENIFGYLNIKECMRAELVCQRWRHIGKTVKRNWPATFDIQVMKREFLKTGHITDEIVASVLYRCGMSLKKLVLNVEDHGYLLTSQVFDTIGKNCPNLLELKLGLRGLPVEDPLAGGSLIDIAKGCTRLKRLFIRNSYCLDDSSLSLFLKQCPLLECLMLTYNPLITEDFMQAVNRKLKGLYIYNCDSVNITTVASKLVKKCSAIEELCLYDYKTKLNVRILMQVLLHYKSTLKVLHLVRYAMQPCEWYGVPFMLPHLEVLSLRCSLVVDDNLVMLLADQCKKLRELDISDTNISDVGISALAGAPSLKVLDVSNTDITGEGLLSVASVGLLEKFYFRRILCYTKLLEDSCISLANYCPNLHLLVLYNVSSITDRLVEAFCSSLEVGIIKGPVALYLKGTQVNENVACCEKLTLNFQFSEVGSFSEVFG